LLTFCFLILISGESARKVSEENLPAIPLDLPKLTLILAFLHFKGDFSDGIACFITLKSHNS